MSKVSEKTSSGIGLGTTVFIIFLILKLTHVIDWSWWWVTAPLWISAGITLLIFAFVLLILVLAIIVKALDKL